MEIYHGVIIFVALLVIAAAIIAVTKRRSENLQSRTQSTRQERRQKTKADKAMNYLVEHNVTHQSITSRFELYRTEHASLVDRGVKNSAALERRLSSLFNDIDYQIHDDITKMPTLTQYVRDIINTRHNEWDRIQLQINRMYDNSPDDD